MIDLIYDNSISSDISKRFPNAKITDASDDIHESRIQVELSDLQKDEYLEWIVKSGNGIISFTVQIMLFDKEYRNNIIKWIEELKK